MKILALGQHAGSARALVGPIQELRQRGHDVTIYATGNDSEVQAFGDLPYQRMRPSLEDGPQLVRGYELILTGLAGTTTTEACVLRAANKEKILSVAVNDQNYNYKIRFGENSECLPTIIAMMTPECMMKAQQELPKDLGDEVAKRSRVVGWTAYDYLGKMKESFTSQDREKLLHDLSLNPGQRVYLHCTENIHPDTNYWRAYPQIPEEEKRAFFDYNKKLTEEIFTVAQNLGHSLVVKPHPGEEPPYTQDLCQRHSFTFIPAQACDSRQLILAAATVTAGKSSILNDGCLLDKNTGGIVPEATEEEITRIQAVILDAIPYTRQWDDAVSVISMLVSPDSTLQWRLQQKRRNFYVDGKASVRLVDIIEELN